MKRGSAPRRATDACRHAFDGCEYTENNRKKDLKMRKFVKVLALALTLSLLFAAAALADSRARTLQDIKDSGTLFIGVFSDKKPFGYVDENGDYQG